MNYNQLTETGTDFNEVSDERIKQVMERLNNRPGIRYTWIVLDMTPRDYTNLRSTEILLSLCNAADMQATA